jgi:hypothetical protein
MHLGVWGWVLVAAVTLQAVVLTYISSPPWKAFVLLIHVPFTVAALAVGHPIDATNVWGVVLLFLFYHGVRLLHYAVHLPILPAIVVAAVGYCVVGTLAADLLPATDGFFWLSTLLVLALSGIAWLSFKPRPESASRTELPLWIKAPAIACVVVAVMLVKDSLHGFTTVFPMVGVIAAYEARKCLGTICRSMPAVMLTLLVLIVATYLTQDYVGLGLGLLLGWAAYLSVLAPVSRVLLFGRRKAVLSEHHIHRMEEKHSVSSVGPRFTSPGFEVSLNADSNPPTRP